MRSFLSAAACLAAILAGACLVYFTRPTVVVEPHKIATIANTAPQPHPAEVSAMPPQDGAVRTNAAAVMRAKFESASNYAAFIHDAMQRPEEGGRFYALLAYHRCEDISAVGTNVASVPASSGNTTTKETARKVIEELKQRCAGVRAQYPDELTFMRNIRNSNAKGQADILLIARGALIPTNKESIAGELRHAYESNDPYLIAATLDINIDHYAEKIDKEYSNGQNRPVLYMASAAASCEIVGDCQGNFHVMAPCLTAGKCDYADYREYLREDVEPQSRELFDKTKQALVEMSKKRVLPM